MIKRYFETGAWLRWRALRALLSVAVLCCGVLAFGSASAFGAYRLVGSFGEAGPGAGQFEEPAGMAVESSTGDVFVNAGVVLNDVQTVTPPSSGTFTLAWEGLIGEHKAIKTGAQGTGSLKAGSEKVTVTGVTGTPLKGEAIEGGSIPSLTTIETVTEVTVGEYKLELSAAPTATEAGVTLKVAIPYNAAAELVKEAVGAAEGDSSAFVTGGGGAPFVVEFAGARAEQKIETLGCEPLLTCTVVNAQAKNTRRVEKWEDVGGTYTEVGMITASGSGAPAPFQATEREPGTFIGGVAVDNDPTGGYTGDVYVAAGGEDVDQFEPEAGHPNKYKYVKQFEVGSGNTLMTLAVSPENGDVYATNGPTFVEYEPNGHQVVEQNNVGSFQRIEGLAVSGSFVYVAKEQYKDREKEEYEDVDRLLRYKQSPTSPYDLEEETVITEVLGPAGFDGVTVDPASGGDVFLLSGKAAAAHVEVFGASEIAPSPPIEEFSAGHIGESIGIAYSPFNEDVYVSDLTNSNVHAFHVKVELPKFKLIVAESTEGEVVGSEGATGINCGTGAGCKAEIEETEPVALVAKGKTGFKFEEWTEGPCVGAKAKESECKFSMPSAETKVAAKYGIVTTSPLTVFITGKGTVKSSVPNLVCLGEECTQQAKGTVTLTGEPDPGYILAGWIGCKKASGTTCTVEMTQAREVTAVFLAEGKTGSTGGNGKEGEGGLEGGIGEEGLPGKAGAQGERGAAGASGATGSAGAQGPPGPAGKEGPAGKVELVTCKKVGKKQECTTKTVSGTVKFTTRSARATLSRHGVVFAAGAASESRGRLGLRLISLRKLRPGRYTLTLISGAGRRERIHSEAFTLG